ncbi:peptide ABC transporter substrate-binding protein [Metabacillus endolithicus]|uniref:Peptide ABC transporter substrate-binding protein n=1 Tax=Metabacillus endolithicus TaxID=1535204 RepID=A0ABW5C171_9BACI|nr:peptide ABC transporter substrate-binding protein [Metabacillus endolithicus]UPG62388.1 peptide ABC transporter substrate-binding protein [Metabacillus endolithicus]
MKKSKLFLLLALSLVLSMFLAACNGGGDTTTETEGDKDTAEETVAQELKVLETSEIPSMDSVMAQDAASFTALANTMEGLYRLDQEQNAVPGMADGEPEVSEDGLVYTVKLKEAKWSNGDPVTADDFVFAWQRAIDPATASPYGPYMMEGKIKGAKEITAAAAEKKEYDLNTLGIKAIDEKTLEITLEKPVPYFESLMAFGSFYPQNRKFVEEQGDKYATSHDTLLYNGPFVMTNWGGTTATDWTMGKNAEYWDAETVSLETIQYNVLKDPQAAANAYETGEADITGKLASDIVPQYEGDPNLVKWLEPTIFWIKMNQQNEALANENIRRAIATAFNKEDLATSILNNGSVPANYAVPAGFVNHPDTGEDFREANGDLLTYNVEEAKKLWEQGLKELGTDSVELVYLGGDTETSKKTDAYIKDQLEKNLPGLTIDVQSVPFSVRLDRDVKMDYDLQFAGWGPDYQDAISFSDLWITDGGNNKMAYSNEQYDKLLEDAQYTYATEPAKRFEALQQAEKIVLEEDAALAPVYQRSSNVLVADKVEGFTYHFIGPEYSYKWVKIK